MQCKLLRFSAYRFAFHRVRGCLLQRSSLAQCIAANAGHFNNLSGLSSECVLPGGSRSLASYIGMAAFEVDEPAAEIHSPDFLQYTPCTAAAQGFVSGQAFGLDTWC
jgi:hypothetical protein